MSKVTVAPCYVCGQSKGHNEALHQNDIEIEVINGNNEALINIDPKTFGKAKLVRGNLASHPNK